MLTRANVRPAVAAVALAVVLAALLLSSCSEPEREERTDSPEVVAQAERTDSPEVVAQAERTDSPEVIAQADLTAAGDVTDAAVVESDAALPRLLDLGADKCVPCKMMAPILEELRETYEGELDVVFIDVWKDRSAGEQYGVRVIPTQIFFAPDGSELFRHQGFLSREDILAKWFELGYAFGETVGGD